MDHDRDRRPSERAPVLTLYTMADLIAFVALIRGEVIDPAKIQALAAQLDTSAGKLQAAMGQTPGA